MVCFPKESLLKTEQKQVKSFFMSVGELLGKTDSIERIQVFRIYHRDVRFSGGQIIFSNIILSVGVLLELSNL